MLVNLTFHGFTLPIMAFASTVFDRSTALRSKVRHVGLCSMGLQLLLGLAVVTSSCSGNGTPNVKVQFVNPKVGWIVGKNLWRTEDGGVTWTAVRGAGFGTFDSEYIGYGHRAIQFVDPDFGIQLGAGVLAKTVDGGRTWSEYPLPESTGQDIPPQTVVFLSRELGWLVGKFIYRTNDGAKTWQALTKTPLGPSQVEPDRQFHPTYADYMPALWFTDSSHGVMARVDGHIYVTNDGGVSWEKVFTADRMIRDLVFVDRNTGWIVGTEGLLMKTDDGGRVWNVIPTHTEVTLHSISFGGKRVGCAAGDNGTILCTNDSGKTWGKRSINGLSAPISPLGSISLLDENRAWAVGGKSQAAEPSLTSPSSLVVRSDDGGLNWYVVDL